MLVAFSVSGRTAARRKAVLNKVVQDRCVCCWMSILQIQTMTGAWDDRYLEVLGLRQIVSRLRWDARVSCWRCETVATAVRSIPLACDDVDRAGKVVDATRLTAEAQELTNSDRLAVLEGVGQDGWIEVSRRKEDDLDCSLFGRSEVAIWQGENAATWFASMKFPPRRNSAANEPF